MPYKLYLFEAGSEILPLPSGNPEDPVGIGMARETLINLPDGGYDSAGDDLALPAAYSVTKQGVLYAADGLELEAAYQRLLSFHGKRGKLYRQWLASSAQEWTYARLMQVSATRKPQNQIYLPVSLDFSLEKPIWWSTVSTHVTAILALTTYTAHVANPGTAPILDAVITVHAAGTAITAVTISVADVSKIQFTGTIAAGTNLVIDVGAGTVLNNGVNAFNNLAVVLADHHITEWLRMEADDTTDVIVQRTGGSNESTIAFDFVPAWR